MDFRLRIPVIFALGLANQDCTLRVPNFDRVLGRLPFEQREFVDPGMIGPKVDSLTEQGFVPALVWRP